MRGERYLGTLEHDTALLHWYAELVETGDLTKVLTPNVHPIGKFIAYFQRDVELWLEITDGRVIHACWLEPALNAAFLSLWIAADHRHRRASVWWYLDQLDAVLHRVPVILGLTRQPDLLRPHEEIGYDVVGRIPKMWHGDEAWLVTLTREGLEHGRWWRYLRRQGGRANRLGDPAVSGVSSGSLNGDS